MRKSFMDPDKISEGLSLIWLETHKWQVIADKMGRDKEQVTTELRNLYKRRTAIVHETDRDPCSANKMRILPSEAERSEDFVSFLGETICSLLNE